MNLEDIKLKLAKNNVTPSFLIKKLSNDENTYVRRMVAQREDLSQDLVEKLALDESIWVRGAIKKCYGITQEPEPQDLTM
ncbi:hypothetical protein [Taylorella equigenitalis]|uniref:Leucine rich repeat variant n=2 Tax=Taylorella equigenitalis TaxID=29575 RepID=A0A654KGT1_TAYEM|nr:hypothetical protein [Taylorella equigenitalis]ADU91086.1 Leucine rich repeat variant [Taylorella equigenitalis MCE9]AFN36190.1 hypothetical protein KUI_1125 [Taylorella equigenitalis ATCC 35865]ASY39595.1 hypothetical protein CA604_05645 [Taylorella equigenitalis]WDU55921.1 hypothetical protein KPH58_05485 [Taylorella equigenitalis]VEG31939.1 Uncharacterised protein [Taylorella equigenitalis ATCC 35865]